MEKLYPYTTVILYKWCIDGGNAYNHEIYNVIYQRIKCFIRRAIF